MMNQAIARALAGEPTARLVAAARSLGAAVHDIDKSTALAVVAAAIDAGQITLAQVKGTPLPTSIINTSAPVPTVLASSVSAAVSAAASAAARAESVALEASTFTTKVSEQVTHLTGEVQGLNTALESITQAVTALRNERPEGSVVDAAIRAVVESRLGPIIEAAQENGTVEQVKAAVGSGPVERVTVLEVFGHDLRDIKGNPLMVDLWADPEAPTIDPNYIWQEHMLRALVISAESSTPLWFGGEKGTGKTQAAMQWAARTGRAFTRINFHKYTSAEEYLGATGLVNGNTQFVPGAFLTAYTHPGAVVLLDETTNADPAELAPLNAPLERGTPRMTWGDRVWHRAPGVMVIAADNTLTNGDASGRYSGTRVMNSALADRFGYIVPVTWLPADQEAKALERITGCKSALAIMVVNVLTAARAKASTGELVDAPSIRAATAWIEGMPVLGVRGAWDVAVASRQPAESAVTLEAIFTAHVNPANWESKYLC